MKKQPDRNIYEYFALYTRKARRANVPPIEVKEITTIARTKQSYEECRTYLLEQIARL